VKVGNSLVGVLDPGALARGVPKEAYEPKAGDEKEAAKGARKANEMALKGIQDLYQADFSPGKEGDWAGDLERLARRPEDTPEQVAAKAREYEDLRERETLKRLFLASDLWTAAFFQPLRGKGPFITTEHVWTALRGGKLSPEVERLARELSERHRFFHWWLEFPDVLERGGFDVVLGNPPWEKVKLEDKQFFADKAKEIAEAENAAKRRRMIAALEKENPALFKAYQEALAEAEAVSGFLRHSGRFPLTARGDINTYPLFAELGRSLLHPRGRMGMVLPTGIATDDSSKEFFGDVVERGQLAALLDFENREGLFSGVHRSYKFSVFVLRGGESPEPAKLLFFATRPEHAEDPGRLFTLSPEDFALLNPNTKTCPVFRTRQDAELTLAIYSRVPVLWREEPEENPWGVRFLRLFDMSNDSHLFRTREDLEGQGFRLVGNRFVRGEEVYLPLYEAKMFWHYDHRFATFAGKDTRDVEPGEKEDPAFLPLPRYWVPKEETEARLREAGWERRWLLGFRNVTNATNERTVVVSRLPLAGVGNSAPLLLPFLGLPSLLLEANLSALVLDYVARQKVGGTNLNFHYIKQFPILPPDRYTPKDLHFIVPRVLELAYTAWDLAPLAQDVWEEADEGLREAIRAWVAGARLHPDTPPEWVEGPYPFPPFVWDEERRALLRAELDAYYARLYGLNRKQLRYILDPQDLTPRELEDILSDYEEVKDPLDEEAYRKRVEKSAFPGETFRVLKDKDIRRYGEYRTRRLVLEAWERLLAAHSGLL
jgi:hypothetical protein